MGRDYTQLGWVKLILRAALIRPGNGEKAASLDQVDYIEQELLFIDITAATETHV